MRRAARTDTSQDAIVRYLRQCGISVEPRLARVGQGVPDLLCGWRNRCFLLEVKTGSTPSDRKLTAAEAEWHASWPAEVPIVSTPEEAVEAVLRMAGEIAPK